MVSLRRLLAQTVAQGLRVCWRLARLFGKERCPAVAATRAWGCRCRVGRCWKTFACLHLWHLPLLLFQGALQQGLPSQLLAVQYTETTDIR